MEKQRNHTPLHGLFPCAFHLREKYQNYPTLMHNAHAENALSMLLHRIKHLSYDKRAKALIFHKIPTPPE